MKSLLRHILAFVFLLASLCICNSQEVVRTKMDEDINRYEMLCEICLNLRTRIQRGEDVSRSEAQAFINRFLEMNKDLKGKEDYMTPVQKQRFAAVTQWFSTGERPSAMEAPNVPREEVLTPIDNIPFFNIASFDEKLTPAWGSAVKSSQSVEPSVQKKAYLLYAFSPQEPSDGMTVGYSYGRWGGYASFRSNYKSISTSYSCLSKGYQTTGGAFWANGNMESGNMTAVAGCLAGLNRWLAAYAGLGCGWRKVAWQDIDGVWAEVSDLSYSGLAIDTGILCSWKFLTISAGVSIISFRSMSTVFGVGINF